MIDKEVLGVGVLVLVYVLMGIFGFFVAIAPLFCWIHLRKIRRRQTEIAQKVNEHLWEMRRSLASIDDALRRICSTLDKK